MFRYIFAALVVAISYVPAYANCPTIDGTETCGPATTYQITVEKVEFCTSSACANPVTVASSTTSFNIASAAAGAAVGEYANLDSVDAGIYTHVRTTLSPNVSYLAPVEGGCSAVTSSTPVSVATIPNLAVLLQASQNEDFNLAYDGTNLIHRFELSSPIAISKAGSLPQVQIDFSTSNAHICHGGVSYPGIPFVDIQVFDN